MHHADRHITEQFQHMVAIRHLTVEAVAGRTGESQPSGQLFPVDGIRGSGQRAEPSGL